MINLDLKDLENIENYIENYGDQIYYKNENLNADNPFTEIDIQEVNVYRIINDHV